MIKVNEKSPRFTHLLGPGRRDLVATLATFFLLSYTKPLSTTIAILSFAVLDYPDGSRAVVWLPDGNVRYFHGKHIALVVVAFLIILVGIPYKFLLFFWQWLIRISNKNLFRWTKDTKLNAIMTTYHAPYNYKHRYWTGLFLFVRLVLYNIAAITKSDNPQASLLTTILVVRGLLVLKGIIGMRVYKNTLVDIMETLSLLNLLALATFTLYNFKAGSLKQTIIAYISTVVTLLMLVSGIIFSHNFAYQTEEKSCKRVFLSTLDCRNACTSST